MINDQADLAAAIAALRDDETERQLLRVALENEEVLRRAQAEPDDFAAPGHGAIWALMHEIVGRGDRLSLATLSLAAPVAWRGYISLLVDQFAVPFEADQYDAKIIEFSGRRKASRLAFEKAHAFCDTGRAFDKLRGELVEEIQALPSPRLARSLAEVTADVKASLVARLPIYSTGLDRLDVVMGGGLVGGKCYGIGAEMKVGKTVLAAATLSFNLNRACVPHLYVSLELRDKELVERSIARAGEFNPGRFLTRVNPTDLQQQVDRFAAREPNCVMFENARGSSLTDIERMIAGAHRRGAKGAFVDYLQLIRGGGNRYDTEAGRLEHISNELAGIAIRYGIFVVVVAQLNEQGTVLGSRGLHRACDMFLRLHRPGDQDQAWLTMEESRYTRSLDVGSKESPALWFHRQGPYFSERAPRGESP